MSFFSWFGKKARATEAPPSQSSGLGQVDATVPMSRSQLSPIPVARSADATSRRNERLERRELLYSVVRECMTGAGVLSSTYKFKVLSLDSSGRKYLIMMDIPQVYLSDPARFAEIEGAIARGAKERFDILVTAVYWRVNELVTAGRRQPTVAPPIAVKAASGHPVIPAKTDAAPAAVKRETSLDQEVLAFKQLLSSAARGAAPVRPGEVLRSGPRNPTPLPDFSDTEPVESASPLGPSQFGGLS
jgi:hypothetical protein